MRAHWDVGKKESKRVLRLQVSFAERPGGVGHRTYAEDVLRIEKLGKRKNWVGGREGEGCKIEASTWPM